MLQKNLPVQKNRHVIFSPHHLFRYAPRPQRERDIEKETRLNKHKYYVCLFDKSIKFIQMNITWAVCAAAAAVHNQF